MYTIVDIETTGNGVKGNKITEIAILKHDGNAVIAEFSSLVNPECQIPRYITTLTGIDNALVSDAPVFAEIAQQVLDIIDGTIFVAHNVNFDYNIIKHELQLLGLSFQKKKLCTIRLSRKLFPGHQSYSLGKLCTALQIPLFDRHRAMGDAKATVILFEKLLRQKDAVSVFNGFLKVNSREATLPPSLPKAVFDRLPDVPGVYYFKDEKGKIIYVGKAKSIKNRVLSHFYDKSNKEILMCQETADIDFELSGSELLAFLMESAAIKNHFPKYNKAQKLPTKAYAIFAYEDRSGITHLAFNPLKNSPNPLMIFYNLRDCRSYLEKLCMDFQLCPKYCHLQENVVSCSHYVIKNCLGVCKDQESVLSYNKRVSGVIKSITNTSENYILKEKGRAEGEEAAILIENGIYTGYGFIDNTIAITSMNDVEAYIKPQKDNLDVQRILRGYLIKNTSPKKIVITE